MKSLILAAAMALAAGTAFAAHAENQQPLSSGAARPAYSGAIRKFADGADTQAGSSTASLTALLAEWDRAGFSPPSKPGQYRVYGRNGYVTSGPEYNAMVSLIRSAANDTRDGRDRDATAKIARARSLLAASIP
jgi:hypothetical protein